MKQVIVAFGIAGMALLSNPAAAGELIYQPLNPGFGGNPLLEDYLVGTAQIQNKFIDSGSSSSSGAPTINFPPISIDLGGATDPAAEPADTGATTADPVAGATTVPQILQ